MKFLSLATTLVAAGTVVVACGGSTEPSSTDSKPSSSSDAPPSSSSSGADRGADRGADQGPGAGASATDCTDRQTACTETLPPGYLCDAPAPSARCASGVCCMGNLAGGRCKSEHPSAACVRGGCPSGTRNVDPVGCPYFDEACCEPVDGGGD